MVSPEIKYYWQESGWVKKMEQGYSVYQGYYSVINAGQVRQFPGTIVERISPAVYEGDELLFPERRRYEVLINDPPPEIRSHPEGRCFQLLRERDEHKTVIVHYNKPPGSVDEAILHIQRVLDESLNPR